MIKKLSVMTMLLASMSSVGCFKASIFGNSSNSNSTLASTSNNSTPSVLMFNQVQSSYSSMLNVTPSNSTVSVVNSNINNFSLTGSVMDGNGPAYFAFTSVAVAFCNDMLNAEQKMAASARTFSGSINFAGLPSQFTKPVVDQYADNLARSCWGKDPSSTQYSNIETAATAIGAAATAQNTAATFSVALGICTAECASTNTFTTY